MIMMTILTMGIVRVLREEGRFMSENRNDNNDDYEDDNDNYDDEDEDKEDDDYDDDGDSDNGYCQKEGL